MGLPRADGLLERALDADKAALRLQFEQQVDHEAHVRILAAGDGPLGRSLRATVPPPEAGTLQPAAATCGRSVPVGYGHAVDGLVVPSSRATRAVTSA